MDVANVRAHYALQPTGYHIHTNSTIAEPRDKNQSFYDSSMTVLFDLPNAIVVSTYVLLTLGFPPRSLHLLASLRKISNVMTLWSASRIAWAGATLAAFLNDIELLQDSRSPVWSSL
eukprot:4330354-Ditylum_brightwellii.AAC.1